MIMIKILGSTVGLAVLALTLATPGTSQAGWLFNRCRHVDHCCQPACCNPCNPCCTKTCYTYTSCCNGYRYVYTYNPCCGYACSAINAAPAPNTASIRVNAPVGATVSVGGVQTVMNSERLFESPTLVPGVAYNYDITAQWTDLSGNQVTQLRRVSVQANSTINVDFRLPAGS
jgi:uncharacterized protein (TIGR03000 family)